jgi:type II secretory pathway pseudopilin PulG
MLYKLTKGLTFVELTIVLVVIGIVMGLALRGRSMIESANVRKELNKIRALELVINDYYTKTTAEPPIATGTSGPIYVYDNNIFYEMGLVTPKETVSLLSIGKEWVLRPCGVRTDRFIRVGGDGSMEGSEENSCYHAAEATYPKSICPDVCVTAISLNAQNEDISKRLACLAEWIIDDANPSNGSGTLQLPTSVATFNITDGCDKYSFGGTGIKWNVMVY